MAIQMIINREFGMSMNENPMQGSYFMEELTDLFEEAVLDVFMKISERGGVLGAMETQFQRSKIQEESLYYEHLKHSGKMPIIGVNTYIDPKTLLKDYVPPKIEMARATYEEKSQQLNNCELQQRQNAKQTAEELQNLKLAALQGKNIFEALLSASRVCTLAQMSGALYEVGGQYRRNL
jgi:methylmalonyl-CoA mutase